MANDKLVKLWPPIDGKLAILRGYYKGVMVFEKHMDQDAILNLATDLLHAASLNELRKPR